MDAARPASRAPSERRIDPFDRAFDAQRKDPRFTLGDFQQVIVEEIDRAASARNPIEPPT